MEKDETVDPNYLKGFNEGYVFAKHLPELSEQLSKTEFKSPRMQGMQDGRKEYLSEKAKEKFTDWLKRDRISPAKESSQKDKGRDLDKS